MTIIGISGFATSGKDTVGQILVEDHGFSRVAFADKLKALALELNPALPLGRPAAYHVPLDSLVSDFGTLDNAKLNVTAVREYLQKLGVAARNHLFEDVWVHAALGSADSPDIVVTDVRFKNEAQAIEDRGGYVWQVNRPGVYPVNGHVSEHDLDDWPFHAHLNNDGTIDDLRGLVAALVNSEVSA